MRILLSDEKSFDIDSVYNSQNDPMWAVTRADADEKDGIQPRQKISTESNDSVERLFQERNAIDDFG